MSVADILSIPGDGSEAYAKRALEMVRLAAWWEAYLAVLPVLLAANPDGDPTRKAAHLADFSVGAFDRAQPSDQP